MASKKNIYFILVVVFCSKVESASLLERSYEYVMNLGKNLAPSFMSILDCMGENDAWDCAKERAGKILDSWNEDVEKQRRSWQEAADAEVSTSGRAMDQMPSEIGRDVEESLNSLATILQHGVARALSSKKHDSGGGIDSITISAGGDRKKMKKKKQKPPKIHLIHPVMLPMRKAQKPMEKGRGFPNGRQTWVIGDSLEANSSEAAPRPGPREARGVASELWAMGEEAIDAVAEHALESENADNGIADKSSLEEQRGKKKKKKKAILKLLILGAVLKAKIGTLLQILSFKLQVKFFVIALIGLAINLARLWIDIKNKHNQQPQKVIYYEHAQHQHHYDHEEAEHGWGPWSRNNPEEEVEIDLDVQNRPYRAYDRSAQVSRT